MPNGILNVLKPPGLTSHDVISFVRKRFGIKRVGHAGTLDPAAAGVLPVFLGQSTRLIEYLGDANKSYRAELKFGYETDTGDDTGQIISCQSFKMPDRDSIQSVLSGFIGENMQTPPMFSAIKVNGKKLYEMAREGLTVERKPRRVYISQIDLVTVFEDGFLFDVTCSKGTYIRSICTELGQKFMIPAVMSFLVRTRVGNFLLGDASTLEEIEKYGEELLLPPDAAIEHLTKLKLSDTANRDFQNGKKILLDNLTSAGEFVRLYSEADILSGVGLVQNDKIIIPVKVFH